MSESSILEKVCTACACAKPATLEHFHASQKYGLTSQCRDCRNSQRRAKRAPYLLVKEVLPEGLKRCTKCRELHQATAQVFGRHKATADRLGIYCRSCAAQKLRERRDKKGRTPRQWPNRAVPGKQRCWICLEFKPISFEHFARSGKTLTGFRRSCKSCEAQRGREWRDKNPEKCKAKKQRRRALVKACTIHFTAQDVRRQLEQQSNKCYWCQSTLTLRGDGIYHVDHLIPLSKGGSNGPENIVCTCSACNLSKHNKLPHEWTNRLL